MIVVTLALVAAAITASVSCSVYACQNPDTPRPNQSKTVCHLREEGTDVVVTNSRGGVLCRFKKQPSLTNVHNIYRLSGVLQNERSKAVLARFYHNTVGKGGFIEVWPNKAIEPTSFMLSILHRFQPAQEPAPPTKIFISSKLTGNMYDISIDEARYQWSMENHTLRSEGPEEALALTLDYTTPNDVAIHIYNSVIKAHLSVCLGIFFAIQKKR